jgi:hypothetical protein
MKNLKPSDIWDKESKEWQQASANDVSEDLEAEEWEKEYIDFMHKQFSVNSWSTITDNNIKFIRSVRQQAIEKVLKELISNPWFPDIEGGYVRVKTTKTLAKKYGVKL